ncbi:hypothetical protein FH608_044430 [Nonomuraea phyllanthi]|uniref:Zinc transporter ZupT n=1 Tax=Nonomuraea phyllanthi TaxID=2219224 RepID=A0A5C4VD86_9ACTN|nr:hypothetical protein [Nonomuraea phyllanthi]KAB8188480.1 hypothetical protein FH608_044430 [Nonomuraea phyllanthi]
MFVPAGRSTLAAPVQTLALHGPSPEGSGFDAALPAWTTWAAVALVTLSTLAGALLARRNSARIGIWLAVASALMLVTALVDLLPDAWQEAKETGVPFWLVGLAGVFGFVVITYFTRKGCGHGHDDGAGGGRHAPGLHRRVKQAVSAAVYGGVGTAAALSLHRMIEGATLALAASAVVIAALVIHSASEGLALTALLDLARTPSAPWLALSCLAPVAGVVLATAAPLPAQTVPVLLGMVTGVLLRTAVIGLTIVRDSRRLTRRHLVLAATAVAGVGGLLIAAQTLLAGGPSEPSPPVAAAHGIAPATVPRAARTPKPSQQMTAAQLRDAVTAGHLSLEQLLSRRDPATIGADAAALLRALPRRSPGQIARTLRQAKISAGTSIGDLTLLQRHLLLTALSDTLPGPRS